ncbi:MAG: amidohydrolase family protein, partial [Actinomycetota bacterium]
MLTLYRASRIHTLSHPPVGEWVLVDDRHVQRVGSGDPPGADRVVELPGTTILPGFIDAHVHLTGTGVHHQAPQIAGARSAREMLDALSAILRERSGPVLVQGWDETRWAVRQIPDIHDLDALGDRPVAAVRVDGHVSL